MATNDRRDDAPRRRPTPERFSRRTLPKGGLAALGAGAAGAAGAGLSSSAGSSIERAAAMAPPSANPSLSDIRHVVFLMQENHSFDNYLGMLPVCGQPQDTSVLATIERQWNLPALTYRDANAATLADFLDPSVMSFAEPPELAAPANPAPGLVRGYQGQPVPPSPASTVPAGS